MRFNQLTSVVNFKGRNDKNIFAYIVCFRFVYAIGLPCLWRIKIKLKMDFCTRISMRGMATPVRDCQCRLLHKLKVVYGPVTIPCLRCYTECESVYRRTAWNYEAWKMNTPNILTSLSHSNSLSRRTWKYTTSLGLCTAACVYGMQLKHKLKLQVFWNDLMCIYYEIFQHYSCPVSYTHLTLPTILRV